MNESNSFSLTATMEMVMMKIMKLLMGKRSKNSSYKLRERMATSKRKRKMRIMEDILHSRTSLKKRSKIWSKLRKKQSFLPSITLSVQICSIA